MAKKIESYIKLQVPAAEANPSPPVGPALASQGINIMAFCKEYNSRTESRTGEIVPADITVYTDGSFKFELKTSPTSVLIRKAAGVDKGASETKRENVASVTRKQVKEIAEIKMKDLNALDLESAMRQIEGTALSMGITIQR